MISFASAGEATVTRRLGLVIGPIRAGGADGRRRHPGIRRRIAPPSSRPRQHRNSNERRRLLTFVVIGGGATGVAMAGAIAELARVALRHDFRNIDPGAGRASC